MCEHNTPWVGYERSMEAKRIARVSIDLRLVTEPCSQQASQRLLKDRRVRYLVSVDYRLENDRPSVKNTCKFIHAYLYIV